MRNYEMLYIARPELDEAGLTAVAEKVSGLITNNGGEIADQGAFKKQRLAYEIKDTKDGFYSLVYFKGVSKTAEELDRVLKITDEVLRFLIVRQEA
jgi:small subunit ribosomal protein S6